MNASNHLEAALAYAHTLGWAVFPLHHIDAPGHCSCPKGNDCDQAGKHPRTPQGFKDASTEAATIRHWWSQWPQANIGVATGPASGFDVLDVDPRHGGQDSLEEWEQDLGRLPDTVEQLTVGDGTCCLPINPEYATRPRWPLAWMCAATAATSSLRRAPMPAVGSIAGRPPADPRRCRWLVGPKAYCP
jgi:hypothetical protein